MDLSVSVLVTALFIMFVWFSLRSDSLPQSLLKAFFDRASGIKIV